MSENSSDFRDWMRRAEQDNDAMQRMLQPPLLWEVAAFHAQQLAEKYLRAYLVNNGWRLKKIHDLTDLLAASVEFDSALQGLSRECELLTPFAMSGRYPGPAAWNEDEFRGAIAAAQRIRAEILKRLPDSHA